jgi:RecA/RadA recombinase
LNESEVVGTEKSDAKIKMGGRANLISWGTHRILGSIRRNKIAVLYINQQRQIMDPNAKGAMQMPGGEVLKHMSWVIIQMKNGGNDARVLVKEQTDDKESVVEIGREVVAVITRSQVTEGSKMRAPFMFYNKRVEGYPYGVDVATDIFNTGKRLAWEFWKRLRTKRGASGSTRRFPSGYITPRPC